MWTMWWGWWGCAFECARGGGGQGLKNRNRAAGARFWLCRVKRQLGGIVGGSGMGWTTCWRWWGCAFERPRGGGGQGRKKRKPSRWRSVSAVPCQRAFGGDSGRVWGGVENVLEV